MTTTAAIENEPERVQLDSEYKHSRPLTSCIWDSQNRYVFFGAEDNLVHRYDPQEKTSTSFTIHDSWVRAMAVSPNGELLATGGYDGRLAWWSAAAKKPEAIRAIDAHQGWIRALSFSPDGSTIATCGNDRLVKLWNVIDGKLSANCASV